MRVCEFCERSTVDYWLNCDRCFCGPGTTRSWDKNPTYSAVGWGIAATVVLALTSLASIVMGYLTIAAAASTTQNSGLVALGGYLVVSLLMVPAGALTMTWMWRVVSNQSSFPPREGQLHPLWAVFGWLIPIANLFLPYKILRQLADDELSEPTSAALTLTWWSGWCAGWGALLLSLVGMPSDFLANVYGVGMTVSAVAACVLILFISIAQNKRIQNAKARRQSLAAQQAPPALVAATAA